MLEYCLCVDSSTSLQVLCLEGFLLFNPLIDLDQKVSSFCIDSFSLEVWERVTKLLFKGVNTVE